MSIHPRKSFLAAFIAVLGLVFATLPAWAQKDGGYKYNDSHFHLTNYIQEGTPLADYVKMMDGVVKRSTVFGIPLQQTWDYENTGDFAPTYYLQSDAPLYYYSFTDAFIAMSYKALPADQQARLDPMITGFNPADMYAADHIRRVLLTFPGVFSGIGEFSIHKEFVSSKIAGGPASLKNPALDSLLDFAGEVGLVVILHSDIDMPFPKQGQDPYLVMQMKELIERHPKTTIIWAHAGLGRVVHPVTDQVSIFERGLANPKLANLYIDISWDETAKWITKTPEGLKRMADLMNKYPDRFLFGTDVVAPQSIDSPMAVYNAYAALWKSLTPETRQKVLFTNYERLFDAARVNVRAWEEANVGKPAVVPPPTPVSGYEPTGQK
ncbi:MAG: amidohydrolase [Candidatus Krumholzibacteria bacterium]|nr:amidohydrolase [Candidatus Krumholzibacteria bacterium]MDH4337719.1 amidohydrolase [Candidatus Krumholzibacteria bacterium]MDH5270653.1 amidohydrolase [Candidatus Krumholzibacteria bacterium]